MKHKKSKAFLSLLLMGSVIVNVQGTYPVLADDEIQTITELPDKNQDPGSDEANDQGTPQTPQGGSGQTQTEGTSTGSEGGTETGEDTDTDSSTSTDGNIDAGSDENTDNGNNIDDNTDSGETEEDTAAEEKEEQKTISDFECATPDRKTTASVKIENGDLPEGTELKLEPITDQEKVYETIKGQLDTSDKGAAFAVYKFSFVKGEETIQTPEGSTLKVTIKSPSKVNNQNVTKLVKLKADGTLETVASSDNQNLSISEDKAVATYTTDKLETVAFVGKLSVGYFSAIQTAADSKNQRYPVHLYVYPSDTSVPAYGSGSDTSGFYAGTGVLLTSQRVLGVEAYLLPGKSFFDCPKTVLSLPDFGLEPETLKMEPITRNNREGKSVDYHPYKEGENQDYYYTVDWVVFKTFGTDELRGKVTFFDAYSKHIRCNVAFPDSNNVGEFKVISTFEYGIDDTVPAITDKPNLNADQEEQVSGYKFDGWYYDQACTQRIKPSTTMEWPTGNTMLDIYGKYIPEQYSDMTFVNSIDSFIPADKNLKFSYRLKLEGNNISKNIKVFVGANEIPEKDGYYHFDLGNLENATLRASESAGTVTFTIEQVGVKDSNGSPQEMSDFRTAVQIKGAEKEPGITKTGTFNAELDEGLFVNFFNVKDLPTPAGLKKGNSTLAQTMIAGATGLGAFIFLDKAKKHKKKLD